MMHKKIPVIPADIVQTNVNSWIALVEDLCVAVIVRVPSGALYEVDICGDFWQARYVKTFDDAVKKIQEVRETFQQTDG